MSRVAFTCSTTQGSGDCAENHRESCCSGADCASPGGFLSGIARLSLARLRVGTLRLCGSLIRGLTSLTLQLVDRLLQSNVPPDKIKIVINRFSSQGALTLEQIEKAIRQPIAITIPNASADLVRAMNSGTPVLPERKSEFAIQMKKWASSLTTGEEALELAEPKRRFAFWS